MAGTVNGFGNLNATGNVARFALSYYSENMALDSHGNAFTSDVYGQTVRKIIPRGDVTTYAGRFGLRTSTDSPLPVPRSRIHFLSPSNAATTCTSVTITSSGRSRRTAWCPPWRRSKAAARSRA